jgi:nitrogen fixation protein NifU and related proteins
MSALRDLYQEVILDHNKSPRNFRVMTSPDRTVEGYNPLCGDHYTISLRMEGDVIREVTFQGAGCAISKASASLMSTALTGKTREEAQRLFELFHGLVTGETDPVLHAAELGKLVAFAGVAEFPARVKCASLPWHTVHAALTQSTGAVTTE